MRAVMRATRAITTSADESMPSPTTAREPEKKPTISFDAASRAFPTRAMIEAFLISAVRSSIDQRLT
jgi:hypothetical protein